MDAQKALQDIRIRNVSLHRRGQPEYGTLYLTRHHLIFSYQPSVPGSRNVSSQQSSATQSSSNLTDGSSEHGHKDGEQKSSQRVAKAPPKEIYVPYPLIHHCTLRSSYTITAPRPIEVQPQLQHNDELFPPTVGTSAYARPSTDSVRSAYGSPRRPASPLAADSISSARPPALRLRCKDFVIFALHFHGSGGDKTADDAARQAFYALRTRCCVSSMEEMYAFHFKPPAQETAIGAHVYDAKKEFARMGVGSSQKPGTAWRITDINNDHSYSPTYPHILAVPAPVSDNILKYCGSFRSKARIPALAYLHPNGGSITRSSQPLVGVQGKRNPQDEKLVTAIFCSHTSSVQTPEESPKQRAATLDGAVSDAELEDSDASDFKIIADEDTSVRRRVYGSTRRNLFVDARPRVNMYANKAAGGGIEDVANYASGDTPVEKIFLNIANIHIMRASLDKVIEALGNSDYLDLAPNQEILRKSGWLGHIAGILDGAEMVARVVGLGGSHALIHCSDGWDRTSQISALAQVMLDPYYRTIEGLITLIQKDFLSFGHKFKHRQGTEGSPRWFEIENERVQPPSSKENGDANNLQAFGNKALSGARTWFEKNKTSIFRQPAIPGKDTASDTSRPTTPPPNPVLHSSPTPAVKEEKHKMDEKEVAPIFHQFLDAVYQLLYQEPASFEFNERFLRRLLYQSYSGQYGEFLFNCEKDRMKYQGRTPSAWAYFLARKQEFTNASFVPRTTDPLLFPHRQGYDREVGVRWWSSLFGRKDEEMNVPRTTAPTDEAYLNANLSSVSLQNSGFTSTEDTSPASTSTIRAAKSTPALGSVAGAQVGRSYPVSEALQMHNEDDVASSRHTGEPSITAMDFEDADPVSISKKVPPVSSLRGGLDFSAFAQQNAFSDMKY